MVLIAQIALGVIVGGFTIAFLVTSFFIWNSRQRNERLAVGLFIGGLIIVVVLLAVVAACTHKSTTQIEVRFGPTSGAKADIS